jgi:hypothetical protein
LQAQKTAEMKRLIITILLSLSALACAAQTSWVGVDLPWMPERRAGGMRRMVQYIPSDSVIGAREVVRTAVYDRHGYETGPMIDLEYDTLGRLIRRQEKEEREVAGVKFVDTVRIQTLSYSPEGLVSRYSDMSLHRIGNRWYTSMIDTHINTYQLTGMSLQAGLGVTRCTYRRIHQWRPASYFGFNQGREGDVPYSMEATCRCERVFDEQGRLVKEVSEDCDEGLHSYDREFVYDEQGRIVQEYRNTYEGLDTLFYRYNILGQLIGMDGVGYSEDMKVDIHIRCQTDGKPLEETTTWWNLEEEGDPEGYPQAILRTYYNKQGDVVRTAYPGEPVYEYEYEYW